MKLNDWLTKSKQTRRQFAASLGVTPEAVRLWIAGERFPTRSNLASIAALTKGKVKANDFVEAG